MTYDERATLRRLIDRERRARLRAGRNAKAKRGRGPTAARTDEQVVFAVEGLLDDGLARGLHGISREVGVSRPQVVRAIRLLLDEGGAVELPGERNGWVVYRRAS